MPVRVGPKENSEIRIVFRLRRATGLQKVATVDVWLMFWGNTFSEPLDFECVAHFQSKMMQYNRATGWY